MRGASGVQRNPSQKQLLFSFYGKNKLPFFFVDGGPVEEGDGDGGAASPFFLRVIFFLFRVCQEINRIFKNIQNTRWISRILLFFRF